MFDSSVQALRTVLESGPIALTRTYTDLEPPLTRASSCLPFAEAFPNLRSSLIRAVLCRLRRALYHPPSVANPIWSPCREARSDLVVRLDAISCGLSVVVVIPAKVAIKRQ